jgi:hypothetical protein
VGDLSRILVRGSHEVHTDGVMPPLEGRRTVGPGEVRVLKGVVVPTSNRQLASSTGARPRYEFHIAERLTTTALCVFPELQLADSSAGTVLYGRPRDRSELHAILDRFHLLGMTLLDVHQLPD